MGDAGGEVVGSLCGGLCAVCAASALWECAVLRACGLGDTNKPCCGGQQGCCPGLTDCCKPNRDRYRNRDNAKAHPMGERSGAKDKERGTTQADASTHDGEQQDNIDGSSISQPVSLQPETHLQMSVPPAAQQSD